jgi:RNA polymerase sigma-70 factor (ECF subfamily)
MMSEQASTQKFIELYAQYESRLRGYILSLVPHWSDADEITHRCSLVLWKKIDQFEPGSNFFAWAAQIARLEVKEFRKRKAHERLMFGDAFEDAVAKKTMEMEKELPVRMLALQKCVEALPTQHRELLRLRFDEERSVLSVSAVLGRPVDGLYKALSRIRQTLHKCISAKVAHGDL